MTDRELMQHALECLEWHIEAGAYGHDIEGTAGLLRALLAEPEPVAWRIGMTDRELMQQALEYMESVGQMDMHPEEWTIAVALRDRLAQPEQEPVAWMTINAYGEEDDIHYENPEGHLPEGWTYKPLYTSPPIRLRRGDILRCIETDELCTVWATSTTGKTLIKWSANNFGDYTAAQIGELFWLEPKSEQEPVAWVSPSWLNPETRTWESESFAPGPINGWIPLYTAPRQWQGLTEEEIWELAAHCLDSVAGRMQFARAIEAKLKEKNT